MHRKFKILICTICSVMMMMMMVVVVGAESLWVSSDGAKLKAEKSSSAETISELKVGDKLTMVSYEKRWYNVTAADGKTGWIYRGKVAKEPPATEENTSDDSGDVFGDLSGDSSIQANAADSSRSIRGLSPEAKAYAESSSSPKACQDALDTVLAVKVNKKEIEKFLKNGKIGEYAE